MGWRWGGCGEEGGAIIGSWPAAPALQQWGALVPGSPASPPHPSKTPSPPCPAQWHTLQRHSSTPLTLQQQQQQRRQQQQLACAAHLAHTPPPRVCGGCPGAAPSPQRSPPGPAGGGRGGGRTGGGGHRVSSPRLPSLPDPSGMKAGWGWGACLGGCGGCGGIGEGICSAQPTRPAASHPPAHPSIHRGLGGLGCSEGKPLPEHQAHPS